MRADAQEALETVTARYLGSGDFNGTSVLSITTDHELRRRLISQLVEQGKISVEFGDRHPNPHIKAFPALDTAEELRQVNTADLQYACLYPSPAHLATVVDVTEYSREPFTLRLALGQGQLEYLAFDLAVLERYRNDPRYYYDTDDFTGKLCIKTEHYTSGQTPERDKVLLEKFGFGYDQEATVRVVIVFLRYLRGLSPEHQQIWQAHHLPGTYSLHPVYRDVALGNWYHGVSVFDAITEELGVINQMSTLMGRPPLFNDDFRGEKRPRKFGFLLRPTLEEFNSFVQLLEKMLSGNINPAFFKGEVGMEYLEKRNNGTTVAKPKRSVAVLKEWLAKNFAPSDTEWIDKMFATFKKVLKVRQEPAHAVKEDLFDPKYSRQQRDLVIEAYYAVSTLRMAFSNHPQASACKVPEHLVKGQVWTQ